MIASASRRGFGTLFLMTALATIAVGCGGEGTSDVAPPPDASTPPPAATAPASTPSGAGTSSSSAALDSTITPPK